MKSKSKTKPIYAPQIEGAANKVSGVVDANAGSLQGISSDLAGRLPGLSDKAFGSDPTIEAAQGYARDTIGGKYLNGNPYVDEMAGQARSNTFDDINALFGRGGRVGSDTHAEAIGRGLGEAELGVRYGDYARERGMQENAADMAPGLFASQFAGVPAVTDASQTAAELPYTGVRTLASGIGGLLGPYTKTKQKGSIGGLLGGLGGSLLSGWAAGG